MGACCRAQVADFDPPGTYLGERKTDSCKVILPLSRTYRDATLPCGKKKSQKHLKRLLGACVWSWMYVRPVGILEGAGRFLFPDSSHL